MQQDRAAYDTKLDEILRTAAAVFAEKGYHQASIRDISRATGASLSGLYYYVKSKDELLYLVQLRCFTTVIERLERALAEVEEPHHRLHAFIENHLDFFLGNMNEMKVASHEADTLSGDFRQAVDECKRQYAHACTEIIEQLRPHDSRIDPRVATFSLFGMLNWIYNWYRPGRDLPAPELADQMCGLFLAGLLVGGDLPLPSAGIQRTAASDPAGTRPDASIWRT